MKPCDFKEGNHVTVTFDTNSFVDGPVKGKVTDVRDSSIVCEPSNIATAVRFSILFDDCKIKFLMGTKGKRSVIDCTFRAVEKGSIQQQSESIEDILEKMEQGINQGHPKDNPLDNEPLFLGDVKTLGQQEFAEDKGYLNSGQDLTEQEESYKFAQSM